MLAVGDKVKLVEVRPARRGESPGYVTGMVEDYNSNTIFVIFSLPSAICRYTRIAYADNPEYYTWSVREEWITPYNDSVDAEETCISTVLGAICSI